MSFDTSRKAGLDFFGLTKAEIANWDDDYFSFSWCSICKRLCGSDNIPLKILCHFVRWWVYHLMPKKAKSFIDSREVDSLDKLREVLRDYLGVEGSFKDYFKTGGGSNHSNNSLAKHTDDSKEIICCACKQSGHKSSDCPSHKKAKVVSEEGNPARRVKGNNKGKGIVCYSCQEEGHKSNECPYKNSSLSSKYFKKEAKPLKKVWVHAKKEHILEGGVNGIPAKLLLDSGAGISIVPQNLIPESSIMTMMYRGLDHMVPEPFRWPTALVSFKVGDLTWDEKVAVAPTDMPDAEEVIYAFDLSSSFHSQLHAIYAAREEVIKVN